MSQPLVECVPNFSEGRRMEIIESIEAAIRSVLGVTLLDRHMDADHNRSVITFCGTPQAVMDAAYAAIARAAELINLDQHRGEHPRIGATDVVPFVPLSGISLDECAALARALGERVGRELGIPVYLYEAAATRPDRVNLENLRRGEYEGLKQAIATDPDRQPDFGPSRLGPAGATVIGARKFLIAYNIYLTTEDVEVARRIARAVRHSSGGLRHLKALGMLVDGRAQVSMNLTDYTQTPLPRVVELVRREAARYGAAIHHSELVGLIPEAALIDAAQWYLQLDQFQPDQVLEVRLRARMTETAGGEAFLERLAAATPTPGGGSAAAYAGAMAAALAGMVARLTVGKKKYASVEARMQVLAEQVDRLRRSLAESVRHDAEAFDAVLAAARLPRGTQAEAAARDTALESATYQAAQVPLTVARESVAVAEAALEAAEHGKASALSDAASGVYLAGAALRAAATNVRVNAAQLRDRAGAEMLLAEVARLEQTMTAVESRLASLLQSRLSSSA